MHKKLLLVAHQPSTNTQSMVSAFVAGSHAAQADQVCLSIVAPLECQPEQLLQADAVIILTTENLGYMAGATKDWFDRVYYPVLELKQGLPYALVIRAGLDGPWRLFVLVYVGIWRSRCWFARGNGSRSLRNTVSTWANI